MDIQEKMNQLEDRSRQLKRDKEIKVSHIVVDQLVEEILQAYNAELRFKPWYCKLVYKLGPEYIRNLMARVSDAEHPEKLFSKLAKEKLIELEGSNNE